MSEPIRSCASCRKRAAPKGLVRWAWQAGKTVPDLERRLPGRGAWLHPTEACMRGAARGLSRSLRRQVSANSGEFERRLARRARAHAVKLALRAQRQGLVVTGQALGLPDLEGFALLDPRLGEEISFSLSIAQRFLFLDSAGKVGAEPTSTEVE